MTKEFWVMVGIPGSGKSTWIKQETAILEDEGKTVCTISRDYVRKSLSRPEDEYFANETAVFKEFIRQINEAFEIGFDVVIADATHISPQSRKKLLSKLTPNPSTKLVFNVLLVDTKVAIERNSYRTGAERVPNVAIYRMANQFRTPCHEEFSNNFYGFNSIRINILEEGD